MYWIIVKVESYVFHFWRERLLTPACDLPDQLIQLPLTKNAVALTLELEWRRPADDRLAHGSWRAVGRATHGWALLAHVHGHG